MPRSNGVNKIASRRAITVIGNSSTREEAYAALKKKGLTEGLSFEVWNAYNSLPKEEKDYGTK